VYPQVAEVVESGANLISTCEELAYPFYHHPELAKKIDDLAKKYDVTVLGCGVNPGFIMDLLPLVTSGVCQDIKKVEVERVVNATLRRYPLQKKIGIGLSLKKFEEKVAKGGGHVGLVESIAMIGDGLGWKLNEIRQSIEPVIAEFPMESDFFQVDKGEVIGINQVGRGIKEGKDLIILKLSMYLGADSRDLIKIDGIPSIKLLIEKGVHGDIATPAVAVNSIPQVISSEAGLKTMKDLPPPRCLI
jgi:4-hydroxy-tetrahydrodipicolinate reductase